MAPIVESVEESLLFGRKTGKVLLTITEGLELRAFDREELLGKNHSLFFLDQYPLSVLV